MLYIGAETLSIRASVRIVRVTGTWLNIVTTPTRQNFAFSNPDAWFPSHGSDAVRTVFDSFAFRWLKNGVEDLIFPNFLLLNVWWSSSNWILIPLLFITYSIILIFTYITNAATCFGASAPSSGSYDIVLAKVINYYYYYHHHHHHHHHHHPLYARYLYLYSWDKLCP